MVMLAYLPSPLYRFLGALPLKYTLQLYRLQKASFLTLVTLVGTMIFFSLQMPMASVLKA